MWMMWNELLYDSCTSMWKSRGNTLQAVVPGSLRLIRAGGALRLRGASKNKGYIK